MSRPARIAPLACIAALMAVASQPAQADQDPLCGTTITKSLRLDHDIGHCRDTSGPALTIGAPGITVDLNGHRVAGFAAAILNPGFDRVTIKNGVVDSAHDGIQLVGADHNAIRDITALRRSDPPCGCATPTTT